MENRTNPFRLLLTLAIALLSPLCCLSQAGIVGSLGGEMAVTPTGTAVYSIPIEVPPGTKGMQPNLALTYNSAAGRGLLGMGWSLTGLSAITRIPQTPFYDSVTGSVNFDGNDRLALDGTRLVRLSGGDYLATGAVYATETEDFTRVTLNGIPNEDTQHFTAVTQDGTVMEYGNTKHSRLALNGNVYSWWIDKATDPDGNYMTFDYAVPYGEILPSQIKYTGNTAASLGTYATVDFHYAADSCADKLWVGGQPLIQSRLLSGITVRYGTDTVRSYRFEYSFGRNARLTAVVLKDGTGNELTRTAVAWGEDSPGASFRDIAGTTGYHACPGDFDGDNTADLFLFRYDANTGTTTWTVKKGDGNGGYPTTAYSGSMNGYLPFTNVAVTDFNRDGIDDIGFVYPAGADSCLYRSISFNGLTHSTSTLAQNTTGGFLLGDFKGTGGIQVLSMAGQQGNVLTLDLAGENVTLTVPSQSRIKVTDLNGNGKNDLHVHHGNALDVYEYNETTHCFEKIVDGQWMPYTVSTDAIGDFNGDGMQDYAFAQGNATYMKMSKGNDYTSARHMASLGSIPEHCAMLVADINGDGRDDIVRPLFNAATGQYDLHVFYCTRYSDTVVFCDTIRVEDWRITDGNPARFRFSDLNGDGKADLFFKATPNHAPVVVTFPERREHDLVAAVTDGLGATDSLEYGFYNTPGLVALGLDSRRVHHPLVSRLWRPDGIGGDRVTTFSYCLAVYDKARRQVLGFTNRMACCDGTSTLLSFKHDTGFHYLALEHSNTDYCPGNSGPGGYVADPDDLGQRCGCQQYETLYTPRCLSLPHGRFLPYNMAASNVNHLENACETVFSWLDADGRVVRTATVRKKAHMGSNDAPWTDRDSTDIAYTAVTLPNGQSVVRPYAVKTWNKRHGCGETPFRKHRYVFSSGRVAYDTESDSHGTVGVTAYTYNAFGLPIAETYTPDGMAARTKTFAYDGKGRFVTGMTDALGHTTGTGYDERTGLPLSETDANGLATHYQRDALGRVTRVTRPDGTVRNVAYVRNNARTFPDAVYYVRQTETGTPERRTYHDVLGRAVHSYVDGQGYSDVVYDALGRVARKTVAPYISPTTPAASKIWLGYTYDGYGRVVSERGPYTDLWYDYYDHCSHPNQDYRVTVTDSIRGTQRTATYDALGRPVSTTDAGGSVSYAYAYQTVEGEIRDVTTVTVGNAVTTVVSDIRGNRLSIQDPDAGTVACTYNALNQTVTRTDANGCTASYTYDLAGRTTRTVFSKGQDSEVVAFAYDNAPGKGVGRLASVSHDGVLECEYVYDTLGRVANRMVHDGNEVFEHRYAYDALGRLQFLTYPDGFRIKHSYNDLGELEKIRNADNNALVYSVETRDRFRQPQVTRFGNGTGTAYSYNDCGMLTGITNGNATTTGGGVTSGDVGGPIYYIGNQYRELSYTYNDRGFIESRADAKTNQSEIYRYDALDRLVSYEVNGVTAATFAYAPNGNITANSRVGGYSYGGAGPHAVTAVAGNPNCPIAPSQCDVAYNLRNRPALIEEDGYGIAIDYDAHAVRRHTVVTDGNTTVREKTRISELYELETTPAASRRLDYVYAEGRIVAVRVHENGTGSLHYVLTDHLGSWEKVMTQGKATVQQTHFDPWGNRMDYTAWNTPQTQTSFPFDRGFTGHEHYDRLHVINANARLYDPVIGRFFSPDPFVQVPDFTQAFNRYSYCLNNPVMYSDPNGEFFIVDSWIVGFFSKLFKTGSLKQSWDEANKRAGNDAKLWGGLFVTDNNNSFCGRAWEFFSRFTWQAPQTIIGWFWSESKNIVGAVDRVDYLGGATFVTNENWKKIGRRGVTIGNYINIDMHGKIDKDNFVDYVTHNQLYMHEYGHYIQSQRWGPLYLFTVGIPSLISAACNEQIPNDPYQASTHDYFWTEYHANRNAANYFNLYYGIPWDESRYPLNDYRHVHKH